MTKKLPNFQPHKRQAELMTCKCKQQLLMGGLRTGSDTILLNCFRKYAQILKLQKPVKKGHYFDTISYDEFINP